jgi:hypothetical protein
LNCKQYYQNLEVTGEKRDELAIRKKEKGRSLSPLIKAALLDNVPNVKRF